MLVGYFFYSFSEKIFRMIRTEKAVTFHPVLHNYEYASAEKDKRGKDLLAYCAQLIFLSCLHTVSLTSLSFDI